MGRTAKDIVSDHEIIEVHAYARFGGMSPRRVVDEGVLKYAFGYHHGSTARAILLEHGLMIEEGRHRHPRLTGKGADYLRALFPKWAHEKICDLLGGADDPRVQAFVGAVLQHKIDTPGLELLRELGAIRAMRPGQETPVLTQAGRKLAREVFSPLSITQALDAAIGRDTRVTREQIVEAYEALQLKRGVGEAIQEANAEASEMPEGERNAVAAYLAPEI